MTMMLFDELEQISMDMCMDHLYGNTPMLKISRYDAIPPDVSWMKYSEPKHPPSNLVLKLLNRI